ncbi:MAG: hypothetical protein IRY99_01560 [Isosphaeraceae bacterium]|nr:hypothetical protein [Isosphaeraceae bacterium]
MLSLIAVAHAMNTPHDHNEQMYVTAGYLAQHKALYSDFSYVQMPYLPYLYAAIYKITGTSHYLLWAKAITCVFWTLGAYTLFVTARRVSGSPFVAYFALLLFAWNRYVLRALRECSNYILPIFLFNLCFYLFLRGLGERSRRPGLMAACGLCAALGVGTKLYYLAAVPPFLLLALAYPREESWQVRLRSGLLPLLAGLVLGLLPVAWLMIRDLRAFAFNNLIFHFKTTQYDRPLAGRDDLPGMDLVSRGRILFEALGYPTSLCIVIGIGFAALLLRRRPWGWRSPGVAALLAALCLVLTSAAVAYMNPLWPQYFAMPVPFAILLLASLCGPLPAARRAQFRRLAIVLGVVTFAYGGVLSLRYVPWLFDYERWTPTKIRRAAQAVRRHLPPGDEGGRIATLRPLYALEAGLPFYDQFAADSFLYIIGDMLTPEERVRFVTTSPQTVEQFLRDDPPRAIVVGFYKNGSEDPLIRFAEENHYRRLDRTNDAALDVAVLYVRPSGGAAGGGDDPSQRPGESLDQAVPSGYR